MDWTRGIPRIAMTAEAASFSRSWHVGEFTATLTIGPLVRGHVRSACIAWEPRAPERLSSAERREYRRGRARAMPELAREIGGTVAVVEI